MIFIVCRKYRTYIKEELKKCKSSDLLLTIHLLKNDFIFSFIALSFYENVFIVTTKSYFSTAIAIKTNVRYVMYILMYLTVMYNLNRKKISYLKEFNKHKANNLNSDALLNCL